MATGRHTTIRRFAAAGAVALLGLAGCRSEMYDQPRYEPLEATSFYSEDLRSSRDPVAGTVPRGGARLDDHLYRGLVDGRPATTLPMPVTAELVERGRERYTIYCSPCHAQDGYGRGMIVRRGFPQPPSFHSDDLRSKPVGHYFDVITHGYGVMYPYDYRVEPEDRWAIIAYIRALQLSQNAKVEDLPPEMRKELEPTGAAAATNRGEGRR